MTCGVWNCTEEAVETLVFLNPWTGCGDLPVCREHLTEWRI